MIILLKRVVKEYRKSIYTKKNRSIGGCSVIVSRGCHIQPATVLYGSNVTIASRSNLKTPGFKKLITSTLNFPKVKYRFAGKAYRVLFERNKIEFRFHRSHKFYFFYNKKKTYIDFKKNKWVWFKFIISSRDFINLNESISSIRKKNIFTNRGLWNRMGLFYKKKGKISGYR